MADRDRLLNYAQGAEIIDRLKVIGDSIAGRDLCPEGAGQISILIGDPYIGVSYTLGGKTYFKTPSGGDSDEIITFFADINTAFTLVSFYGASTSWKLDSATTGFTDHGDDSRYVNTTETSDSFTDKVSILVSEGWGGFTIKMPGNGAFKFSAAWGSMIGASIRKISTAQTWTVSYNANGGTGDAPAEQVHYDGTTVTLRDNTFTREGYAFCGWSTDPDSGLEVVDPATGHYNIPVTVWYGTDETGTVKEAQTVTLDQDYVFYAIWTPYALVKRGPFSDVVTRPTGLSYNIQITNVILGTQKGEFYVATPAENAGTVSGTVNIGNGTSYNTGVQSDVDAYLLDGAYTSQSYTMQIQAVPGTGYLTCREDNLYKDTNVWYTGYITGSGCIKTKLQSPGANYTK